MTASGLSWDEAHCRPAYGPRRSRPGSGGRDRARRHREEHGLGALNSTFEEPVEFGHQFAKSG
ncbi:hypothetical protein [Streptomyces sp. RG80]|uniref:hypothetical protein n=1 Tax=Streptomyces sp. RG80 TaxID=3157340 RepID=UPI00338E59BF